MKSRKFFSKLKEESYDVSIFDLMNAKVYLEKDMAYLPEDYKKGYLEDFFTFFPEVLKEIRNKTEEELEDFEIEEEEIRKVDLRLFSMGSKRTGRDSYEKLVKTVINYLIFINERPLHALTTRYFCLKKLKNRLCIKFFVFKACCNFYSVVRYSFKVSDNIQKYNARFWGTFFGI